MPLTNSEAMVHYEDTIKHKVSQERIFKHIDHSLQNQLRDIFDQKPIPVWGSRDSTRNRSIFEKMRPGDDVLIVEGENIKLLGKIAAKTINPELSNELWHSLKASDTESTGWSLIYFIANPVEINLPFAQFKTLFGYKDNWKLRGFTSISDEKLDSFYEEFDDLYSILVRLKNNEEIVRKSTDEIKVEEDALQAEPELNEQEVSDHIRMQWKLLNLGLKAGSKVWIPKNDQTKIAKQYHYSDFEDSFMSGYDVQVKYIDNIDVVWKEQFRIDAAFEVENSTSIYSGLLRFSDLKIVAPNSNYPLFIVAPTARKNKVIEQVKRPTFKQIHFDQKVRYLSYEAVDEVDQFFSKSATGLNMNLLMGKSEPLG